MYPRHSAHREASAYRRLRRIDDCNARRRRASPRHLQSAHRRMGISAQTNAARCPAPEPAMWLCPGVFGLPGFLQSVRKQLLVSPCQCTEGGGALVRGLNPCCVGKAYTPHFALRPTCQVQTPVFGGFAVLVSACGGPVFGDFAAYWPWVFGRFAPDFSNSWGSYKVYVANAGIPLPV